LSFNSILAQDTTTIKKDAPANTNVKPDSVKHKKVNFYVSFGIYQPNVATIFEVNGNRGPGAVLSLEQNLGFDANPYLYRSSASVSFKRHSAVELTYVQLNRSNSWEVDREIKIFDTVFDVGGKLDLYVNTAFVAATYKYSIFRKPSWEFGFSTGIRYLQVNMGLSASTDRYSGIAESAFIPAPAPVFGMFGSGYMTPKFRGIYEFSYFNISVEGIRGAVVDSRAALEYYFLKNFGLGGSITFLNYTLKEVPLADNFDGTFKYTLNGFSLYLTAKF
jgi:hypothetical protein